MLYFLCFGLFFCTRDYSSLPSVQYNDKDQIGLEDFGFFKLNKLLSFHLFLNIP